MAYFIYPLGEIFGGQLPNNTSKHYHGIIVSCQWTLPHVAETVIVI